MSYLVRMSLVCAAAFFLLHLALAVLVRAMSPRMARLAGRIRPSSGARLLFALRMSPCAGSLLFTAILCVPSYLRFEHDAAESIGIPCLFIAGLCSLMLAACIVHGLRALLAVARLKAEPGRPLFALVGFLRPRLLVSPGVRETLSAPQMEAAVLHEEAHRRAGDNWKRLAMVVTPGMGFSQLETAWARLAEWAADDAAVQAEPLRAVALAEAMLRMARLAGGRYEGLAPVSTLVSGSDDLGQRVQRLLEPNPMEARRPIWLQVAGLSTAAVVAVALMHSAFVLYVVHSAMERLVQ